MENFEDPPPILFENQITVLDHGRYGSPFPRPLSQYLSPEIAARLLDSQLPRTLVNLEAEISSTDAIITALKALSISKRQARNCYPPVATLPPEILGKIFMVAVNDNVRLGIPEPLNSSTAMTLGGVCSFWRNVAWGLPSLWAVLYCCISHPMQSKKEAKMIQQWLTRAKGLPLTIKIAFENEVAWGDESAPCDVIITLLQFSTTWQSIQLVLPATWYRPLRSLARLPWLEILGIRPITTIFFNQKKLRGFSNAPKLSVLRYDCMFLDKLKIHWGNITKAMIGGPSLDELLEFLKICHSITYCHLVNPTETRGTFSVAPIHQLFLEELYITTGQVEGAQGGGTPISAHTVINLLTTPSLREIHLALSPQDMYDPLPYISDLIRRSHCPLATVKVFGYDLGDDSVIHFLSDLNPVLNFVNH